MRDAIRQLHPSGSIDVLGDEQLLELYAPADRSIPRLRANFISSVDGSSTASGLSGGLGSPADKRVFDLQRQLCDVVIVGAGTVRDEGYTAMRVGADAAAWRLANGLAEHPSFAIVSARLDLDPASAIFTDAPVRPIVITTASAPAREREALSRVADVFSCGEASVDAVALVSTLVGLGMSQLHCEGGPHLLGTLIAADALDELCLTLSPALEGGFGPRIASTEHPVDLREMTLDHVLSAGSMLFVKYSRNRSAGGATQ
jgi:riboflavin biosynthesis pyrimidine reductase